MDSLAILMFLLGVIFGASIFMGYGFYQVTKIKKIKASLTTQIQTKSAEMDQKKDSIKNRLIKASEIAQTQMAIRAQQEMPSKNALHSRYKNGLIGELQDLEQQKIDILRTVLAEGFNPMITILNEKGSQEEIPLSEYVDQAAAILDTNQGNPPPPPSNDPTQPRKAGKFVVYKGGKDDSGTTH